MSRGGIHRKLAQLSADPEEAKKLYAQVGEGVEGVGWVEGVGFLMIFVEGEDFASWECGGSKPLADSFLGKITPT